MTLKNKNNTNYLCLIVAWGFHLVATGAYSGFLKAIPNIHIDLPTFHGGIFRYHDHEKSEILTAKFQGHCQSRAHWKRHSKATKPIALASRMRAKGGQHWALPRPGLLRCMCPDNKVPVWHAPDSTKRISYNCFSDQRIPQFIKIGLP